MFVGADDEILGVVDDTVAGVVANDVVGADEEIVGVIDDKVAGVVVNEVVGAVCQ
jgi:hypothetical protein